MPIFPYDPYDDEEEKRRLLTPGFNPNLPRPMLQPPGNPGSMPAPDYHPQDMAPPSRYQRLEAEKQGYMRQTPGRGKSALTGALRGALSGLASGQGIIGGALSGGLAGAIDPRGAREQRFNQEIRPKIEERFAFEDADRAAARQAGQDELNTAYRTAQIGELESQAYKNRLPPPAPRPPAPLRGRPGDVFLNPTTGQPIAQIPQQPKEPRPPTRDELTIEPDSGKSYEEIAEDSYQSRGGDKYVFDRLPERTRRLISGIDPDADPREVAAANQAFQAAIERQRKTDLNYTRGSVRGRALGARKGGGGKPTSRPGRTAISVKEAADLLK